jgi:hypothetical protein
MTQRTLSRSARNPATTEAWLVAGSVTLLAGLVLADRLIAWMIGEFPTSATLWQLRFEYLRPIGVFYDIALINLGQVSSLWFGAAVFAFALTIGIASLSGVRLARALSSHALLGAALVLTVYSVDPGEGIYARVGVPSTAYLWIGALLSIATAAMCVRAHAEYVGWQPGSSRIVRRAITLSLQVHAQLAQALGGVVDQIARAQFSAQPTPVRVRSGKPHDFNR